MSVEITTEILTVIDGIFYNDIDSCLIENFVLDLTIDGDSYLLINWS